MAKIWAARFAESGDREVIPVPAEPDGSISVTQGWTPDYELPDTDASYKPVGRDEMNGVLFDVTDSLQELQKNGAATWDASLAPYPLGAEVVYSGSRWYNPVAGNSTTPGAVGATWTQAGAAPPSAAVRGAFSNLKASATGLNANVTITADGATLGDGSGNFLALQNVSVTINTAASGVNGLDTGILAANTWYYTHLIAKADGTKAGLLSASATAPTLPAGYTFSARSGAIRTDGSANKYPLSFSQYGNRSGYKVAAGSNVAALPVAASGLAGSVSTPTYVAVGVANLVPPTAASIRMSLAILIPDASVNTIVSPNNATGALGSSTNPPPFQFTNTTGGGMPLAAIDMLLESANFYWANNNGNGRLMVHGWSDNL